MDERPRRPRRPRRPSQGPGRTKKKGPTEAITVQEGEGPGSGGGRVRQGRTGEGLRGERQLIGAERLSPQFPILKAGKDKGSNNSCCFGVPAIEDTGLPH